MSDDKMPELKPCPFCGEIPDYPDGGGTQYEIECDCCMSRSCVQISDLMTIEERIDDEFIDYRYGEEYIERAKAEVTRMWNTRDNSHVQHLIDQAKAEQRDYMQAKIDRLMLEYCPDEMTATQLEDYADSQVCVTLDEAKRIDAEIDK